MLKVRRNLRGNTVQLLYTYGEELRQLEEQFDAPASGRLGVETWFDPFILSDPHRRIHFITFLVDHTAMDTFFAHQQD